MLSGPSDSLTRPSVISECGRSRGVLLFEAGGRKGPWSVNIVSK